MTIDYSGAMGGKGSPEYAEHEVSARAKRVINVGSVFNFSVAPINGAVASSSASVAVKPNKTYRIVSTTNTYIRFTTGASTAVNTDFYLPANTPITVETGNFDTLSFLRVTADGAIQAVEVS